MAGLGPAIHEFNCNKSGTGHKVVDARAKPGHDAFIVVFSDPL